MRDPMASDHFNSQAAKQVCAFHKQIRNYAATPLLSLSALAASWGVKDIFVKDEAKRFGLKAFKGLGGSYAMFRILCERFLLDPETASIDDIKKRVKRMKQPLDFITCTDGNHGKGVSWAAGLFDCWAHIFMPAGTVEARAEAIRNAGPAEVIITEMNYDDTVRYAKAVSEKNSWILIQDTSWEGYETIPTWIMQGYLTMVQEITDELKTIPTHLFLQAGVGSMAAAVVAYMADYYGKNKPETVIVEPEAAGCFYASIKADDGKAHSVESNESTIMAGLNCGTPCSVAWPILRDQAEYYVSCKDHATETGMRTYAYPLADDPVIVSGESGAATLGAAQTIMADKELEDIRKMMRLNEDSVLLFINTEGDTDPENYQNIITEKNY
ncbi:MAG: diaminopropionate ammonia-lyase [Erysipelotrichaceae bacterium]|nr:diaminopropionate ammonia-lyase [Erysipelotrichaceae bacterium]